MSATGHLNPFVLTEVDLQIYHLWSRPPWRLLWRQYGDGAVSPLPRGDVIPHGIIEIQHHSEQIVHLRLLRLDDPFSLVVISLDADVALLHGLCLPRRGACLTAFFVLAAELTSRTS